MLTNISFSILFICCGFGLFLYYKNRRTSFIPTKNPKMLKTKIELISELFEVDVSIVETIYKLGHIHKSHSKDIFYSQIREEKKLFENLNITNKLGFAIVAVLSRVSDYNQ